MPQLVTNSRGDVRDVSADNSGAAKTWGGSTGWASMLGISGMAGRNQDLTATRSGAAAAYQLVPPINRAVNLRSNAVNALTWKLMDSEGNELDNSENAQPLSEFGRMLKRSHQYSRIPLLGQISYSYDLYGECYIEPLGNGYRYNGVKWLNPLGMWVDVRDGEIVGYRWSSVNGNDSGSYEFKANEIAYDHSFNPFDDFRGQGLVEVAMDTINIDRNLQRYMQAFFRNNAMPGVLVSPKDGSTWDKTNRDIIKTQVENFIKGSDNAFSTLVAPMPADWTTFDPPDIQNYYSIDEPLTRKILMIFGVPLAMAGDETGARYKTGKDVLDAFYLNTIIPLATSVRDYINNQLLPFFDDGGATFQFDVSAYDQVSEDDERRSRVANANYAGGLWSQQEARVYTKQDEQLDALDTLFAGQQAAAPASEGQQGAQEFTVEQTPRGQDDVLTEEKSAKPRLRDVIPAPLKLSAIDAELSAWQRKASKGNALKAFVCTTIPPHVEGFVRDELERLGADAERASIKALFDDVALLVARKDYGATSAAFKLEVESLIQAANDDENTRRQLSGALRSALRRYGLMAFRDGLERGGDSPESLSQQQVSAFQGWLGEQSAYVTELGAELFKEGQTPDPENRAGMWVSKSLDAVFYLGLEHSAPDMQGTWKVGSTEHCDTCRANEGQTKSIKDWRKQGLPRSDKLDCKGYKCACDVLDEDGERIGAI